MPLFSLKSRSEQLMMTQLDAVGASIKVQILQSAMLHSDVGTFDCYVVDNYGRQSPGKSPAFVAEVLGFFMRGIGCRVPDSHMFGPDRGGTAESNAARQLAFREKLGTQIHSLTGNKPRWAVETDGTYGIFSE